MSQQKLETRDGMQIDCDAPTGWTLQAAEVHQPHDPLPMIPN